MTTVSKESGLRPHMHALGPEGRLRFPGITEGPLAVRRLNGTDWLVVVGTPTDPLTDLALPRYANLVGEWVAGYSTQQTGNPETRAKASARVTPFNSC